MAAKLKMARCHPDRENYYGGKCKACYEWFHDPSCPCPHSDRKQDRRGRCSSCNSRWCYLKRAKGVGDKFGTPRSTESRLGLEHVKDSEELKMLVSRKRRLKLYNLTLAQYDILLEEQGGVCAICGEPPRVGVDLTVDHDHRCCSLGGSCGKCVRGLLCHGCNMRLGQLETDLLGRSVEYLLRARGGPTGIAKEVRIVSSTGGAKGQKLARFDLIPPRALWELAETYGRGAAKYGDDHNWLRGYRWSLSYAALMRHISAFWSGQSCDPVEGGHHLAAVAWHAFAMLEWEALGLGIDDRPKDILRESQCVSDSRVA